jgi:hypothetical protein
MANLDFVELLDDAQKRGRNATKMLLLRTETLSHYGGRLATQGRTLV